MTGFKENIPYDSLSEDNKHVVKQLALATAEKVIGMDKGQRDDELLRCYRALEPELKEISSGEFDCASYDEFLYRMALAAAAVDRKFTFSEKRMVEEFKQKLGVITQNNAKLDVKEQIEKVKQGEFDLIKVSKLLSIDSRSTFLTFTTIFFLGDNNVSDEEYYVMLRILAP